MSGPRPTARARMRPVVALFALILAVSVGVLALKAPRHEPAKSPAVERTITPYTVVPT